MTPLDLQAIEELSVLGARFVGWRLTSDGRKIPVCPMTGKPASTTNPETWGELGEAQEAVDRDHLTGCGFVLDAARDGICGIDLDACRDAKTGVIASWARKIIDNMASYAEVSPSGTGVKILLRADPVPKLAANRRTIGKANGSKAPAVEIYATARYFTLTGQIFDDVPDEIVDATEAFERLAAWVAKGTKPRQEKPQATGRDDGDNPFNVVNAAALADPGRWVPHLFNGARPNGSGVWRISSKALGRDLEEDISISPAGIVDFGVADMGDPKQGKRTAIDLVMEHGGAGDPKAAALWLANLLGIEVEIGQPSKPEPDTEPEPIVTQPWPEPLGPDAYHGIVGDIVRRIEPETEADPTALLFQFLAAVGSVLGAGAYARVEADKHPPRLWTTIVGRTSKGRKGTALGRIRELMGTVAGPWAQNCQGSGLSSGEGLISCVRDPIEARVKEKKSKEYRTEIVDEGVADKRLLLVEGELAKALKSMDRPGNTLSAVLRDAWDHGNLRTLIKNNPHRATDAHVSLIAHVTDSELRRYLTGTEMANGFANRMMFICVRRSKELPRGGLPIDWSDIETRLNKILAGRPFGEIHRTAAFWALWEAEYSALSADRPGMLGAILGRAEAQVLRLALIYALLDQKEFMDAVHLRAALACWKYAEESARFIFGDTLGDPVADEILRELRQRPDGMTREEIRQHFSGNLNSTAISRALGVLAAGNFASSVKEPTKGRPVERWHARR